jgi:protein SCO1/2
MSSDRSISRPSGSVVLVLVAVIVVLLAVAAAVTAFLMVRNRPAAPRGVEETESLPVLGQSPAFDLIDQEGRPFSSADLSGKVWVANFMFTRCANTCPVQAKKLAALESIVKSVPGLAADVRLVSLSVDAERDQPADLKAYAEGHGADPALWVFLTGRPGQVARLSQEGFQLAAGADAGAGEGGEPAITHSDRFLLVDGEGRLRGRYRPTVDEADMARLERDIRRLAAR